CIFSSRSGNTKEIVEAAKFCKEAGARTIVYVSNDNTPICEYADYKVCSFAEDDHLCEAIYTFMITLLSRFMKNSGEFAQYDRFMEEYGRITPYLVRAKEQYEDRCREMAARLKDEEYHMVVGSGMLWGEAYDYAMCILEEMQWIKTKSIHAAEFFHGTLELVEKGTSILMLYGEDETRPLMDRVMRFAGKITDVINVFDTKEIALPFSDAYFRKIVSPLVLYALTERLSCHLEKERNHPLTIRRYYRQMEY
ncbi:MAG TPA: SIS domain-containing protein, partial [Candidatus Pullichristensenella excrementigallinarum]|nr:SIS domain-containing protein [Candidatus Pullichristensenella excrementigallinarum]